MFDQDNKNKTHVQRSERAARLAGRYQQRGGGLAEPQGHLPVS